jgi:hypothetical protein
LYDGSDKLLDVTMEEEVEMLGEVVATGYQTISRERSTGSVTISNNISTGLAWWRKAFPRLWSGSLNGC